MSTHIMFETVTTYCTFCIRLQWLYISETVFFSTILGSLCHTWWWRTTYCGQKLFYMAPDIIFVWMNPDHQIILKNSNFFLKLNLKCFHWSEFVWPNTISKTYFFVIFVIKTAKNSSDPGSVLKCLMDPEKHHPTVSVFWRYSDPRCGVMDGRKGGYICQGSL